MKVRLLIPFALAAFAAAADSVRVAECVRDSKLDYWAAADSDFCVEVMKGVFKRAGLDTEYVKFDSADGMINVSNVEVICSAFKTETLVKDFNFPLQPLGRMHFALYATPSKAMSMMSVKITEWPRLRVGYSPVSQGQSQDRQNYFRHALLDPEYVEYKTSAGAVQALHDGEIDALFLYTPFGKRPEGVVEVVPIGDRNVYYAVRKGKDALLERLRDAFREYYIDGIEEIDSLRERILGVPRPKNRVRVAAYQRGDMFHVDEKGDRSGALTTWMKTICGHTHWTLDYVYGGYDESLAAVKDGRLDIVGGIGFSPDRRERFLFPHTPIGMIRVYLWAHPGSRFKAGAPSTWKGMRVGLLSGTVSAERVKKELEEDSSITCVEFSKDRDMLKAYFDGEVDTCVDVEMPELAEEEALHVYTAHPMYICTALKRKDLFLELEEALDEICVDFPKYQRMITEHHYGRHSDMAALTMKESEWLFRRTKNHSPVYVDFSPWPFPIREKDGNVSGFPKLFLAEMERRTGLKFEPTPQTGIQTAEAKFMRGETDLWFPYPADGGTAVYGATSVFSQPVPQVVTKEYGSNDPLEELELYARRGLPPELVSILRKSLASVDQGQLAEMFMAAEASRQVVHRVFGMTSAELKSLFIKISVVVLLLVALYGLFMGILLKRQANRANKSAKIAEDHAQAKTRFLAMMSHELRTPLNAVIGFAEFLSRSDADEKKRKEYTDGILTSSNALLGLINDILDLSKLEAGSMNMLSGQCDMDLLLKELPAIFGYRVRKHGVQLKIDAPKTGGIPILALSQEGMRQILINLVGNAAKFTEHGEIIVKVEWTEHSGNLHIEVSDTGSGISPEKMARLFDPFVQDIASRMKSNSGEVKGTGLGLPIVKRMVDAAGGKITADSEIGVGTAFIIDIPNIEVVERKPAVKSAGETIREMLPERVLVVDDMVMNRKILGIHLANMKIKDVRFAENGKQAVDVMKQWKPDLVLTDMWMPEMDGTQLAEAMHRDRVLADIPVVAVTADVDVGSTYDMSLFAKIISKPVTAAKLKALFGEIG